VVWHFVIAQARFIHGIKIATEIQAALEGPSVVAPSASSFITHYSPGARITTGSGSIWCGGGFTPPFGEINSPLQFQIDPLPHDDQH
jgi:uncharacterized membrane protein